ncbi:MAG: HD domain-containing protein [Candidatus Omnitrophica bacterium]|nr:HD domain-containing protein [Candidatus Omnitrophota bacterium]
MKRDVGHQKDLYKKLVENESFKKETDALKTTLKDSIWWVSETGEKLHRVTSIEGKCEICPQGASGKNKCGKKLSSAVSRVRVAKKTVKFDCGHGRLGKCIPIIQGDKIYGYTIVCHSRDNISDSTISLFNNFLDTLIRELQKELELTKLYKTIRPRAIALSTIHTIHRIISATLDLDELLPKLARLCLQIFRVEKVCILLKSKSRKVITVTVGEDGKLISSYERRCKKMMKRKRLLSRGNIILSKDRLCVPLADEDIIGTICVISKTSKAPFDEFDKEILMTLSEQAAIAIKNAKLYKQQEDIILGSIKSMAAILATRTLGTYRIKESFVKIILAMGREMNLDSEELKGLHYAAILHDAGQIAFPDKLLSKTDKLTGKEYNIIRSHPFKSVSIIKHLGFLKPVIPIILHHHENFDGSGYPRRLKGESIPLGARIMAVATAFNAMIAKRPYRRRVDAHKAVNEIKKNSGTQFDPRVVRTFLKIVNSEEITGLLKKDM